jgi:hypothetical protein
MSYIINSTSPFVNIKLTEIGRQKLAQGQLNFTSWAIGDSEINYDRESLFDQYPNDATLSVNSRVLRPVDQQPDIKHFITATSNNNDNLNPLAANDIKTIKAIVNNAAADRGFFSANTDNTSFITYTGDTYIKATGSVSGSTLSGSSNQLVIGTGYSYNIGDYILLKYGNDTVGSSSTLENTNPGPHLWYRIRSRTTRNVLNDTVVLDRYLPNNNSTTAMTQWYIYHGGEVYGDFYGFEETTPYWNTNTLAFDSCCDVSCGDVPVWNMNNVWCENLAGMTGTGVNDVVATPYESYEKFGSNQFLGQKYPYFEVDCLGEGADIDVCGAPGQSVLDGTKKSISIIHYTNNTISNFYGEYFFIDGDNGKNLKLHLPTLMYHRRNAGTESGTTNGMSFIATGDTKLMGSSDIQYIDLIEDPSYVDGAAEVVGKVFPQLKQIVFHDDEIVAAMSYKSNRNWTLPPLAANLTSSNQGSSGGILATNKTMYLTYVLDGIPASGLTNSLPCQYYTKITNNTSNTKDVEFRLGDVDLLPYMRKEEKGTYDGLGFSAREFRVLYQIVDDAANRPLSSAWKEYDFTTTAITSGASQTIDPLLLENQNPSTNGFLIDTNIDSSATTYNLISALNMAPNASPERLQFGDEKFFYGNVETYIGASIFKTIFNLNISADDFQTTGNPTRLNSDASPADIRITEVGIYDSLGNLVMIGKLSKPVKLTAGNTIMIELAMDF